MTYNEWAKKLGKTKINKRKLEDMFDFTKLSNGADKCMRYETFFEAVSWIIVWIKYNEHEKESPLTRDVLEFFEVDNLQPILK